MLGCSRRPSASGMTVTRSFRTVATTELVVPRSMPITGPLATGASSRCRACLDDAHGQRLDALGPVRGHERRSHLGRAAGAVVARGVVGDDLARQRAEVLWRGDRKVTHADGSREPDAARSLKHDLA